ncbi:alpha/beta fold hydrolase [Mangrovibacter yixingensis]|uniref:alpha/beta fold hydrolase n=1 Tax=Mangrovibacter yixingensis TaxID=1529639 RepID=UPI001CFEACB4|nr:alpha/beta hydrolase [Mangrovibacter yixingensis]
MIKKDFGIYKLQKGQFWILLYAFLITGCTTNNLTTAQDIAKKGQLTEKVVVTPEFSFLTWQRINAPSQPLTIYIEGDGLAWISRYQPSSDPTPKNPVALRLAALDPGSNVVYIARPCQYIGVGSNPTCQVPYWTSKRFSADVINAMSEAIDKIKQSAFATQIQLVGYSGGGAVAALLAEQRKDILSLRTVAGYLDIEYVNQLHHVSPMPDSLNPINKANKLALIPQIHFSGAHDTLIPPEVAQRFTQQTGGSCARAVLVPGMTHQGPWETQWLHLLKQKPECGKGGK